MLIVTWNWHKRCNSRIFMQLDIPRLWSILDVENVEGWPSPQLVTPRSLCITLCPADIHRSDHFTMNNLAYTLQLLSVSSSEPKPIWLRAPDFKWIASAAARDGCVKVNNALCEPHSKRASTQWLLALLLAGTLIVLAFKAELEFAFVVEDFISQVLS